MIGTSFRMMRKRLISSVQERSLTPESRTMPSTAVKPKSGRHFRWNAEFI